MKLAFSTLACPGWSVQHIADMAVSLGYDGVELRLLDGKLIDPRADFQQVIAAVALMRERGLAVCALDTSCRFNLPDAAERVQQVALLRDWIRLARQVQVPVLRVFGGVSQDAATETEEDERVAQSFHEVAAEAERAAVTVALETHDAFSSALRVARILRMVNSPAVAALWDSHHPYRVGESVEEVVNALNRRIAHVHIKDARRKAADSAEWELTLMGEGEVPVREQLLTLKQHDYQGWIAVEWEKLWHPEIAEPEVALPQHIAWFKQAL